MARLIYQVPQNRRFIVEQWGRYHRTLREGNYLILWPEKVREQPIHIERQDLKLFEGDWINFTDGSATIEDARAYFYVYSPDDPYDVYGTPPYIVVPSDPTRVGEIEDPSPGRNGSFRVTYNVDDFRDAARELLENALRNHFSNISIDAAAGYNLAEALWSTYPDIYDDLFKQLMRIGVWLERITATQFQPDEQIVQARQQNQQAQVDRRVAAARANEIVEELLQAEAALTGGSLDDIRLEIAADPDRKERLLERVNQRLDQDRLLDKDALRVVRGTGILDNIVARLLGGTN